eukprot:2426164-Prymnesium_polylepis.3
MRVRVGPTSDERVGLPTAGRIRNCRGRDLAEMPRPGSGVLPYMIQHIVRSPRLCALPRYPQRRRRRRVDAAVLVAVATTRAAPRAAQQIVLHHRCEELPLRARTGAGMARHRLQPQTETRSGRGVPRAARVAREPRACLHMVALPAAERPERIVQPQHARVAQRPERAEHVHVGRATTQRRAARHASSRTNVGGGRTAPAIRDGIVDVAVGAGSAVVGEE